VSQQQQQQQQEERRSGKRTDQDNENINKDTVD